MDDLTKLPLHEILLSNGYTLDREKSSRNNPVLVGDDGQKLVISKKGEHYLYFNPNDDNDRGNIISYARIRGISVQELVKNYDPTKEVSLQTTQSFFQNKEQDPYRFIKQYNDFSECVIAQNPLLQRRGFSADMLQAYQGILKQDEKGNLVTAQYKYKCFNHQDKEIQTISMCGYTKRLNIPITKNQDGTLKERPLKNINYGNKGFEILLTNNDYAKMSHIIITESIFDSLAYMQMKNLDPHKCVLLSTSGNFNVESQKMSFEHIFDKVCNARIVLAFDNDEQGRKYTKDMERYIAYERNKLPITYTPFAKDCNDDLKLMNLIKKPLNKESYQQWANYTIYQYKHARSSNDRALLLHNLRKANNIKSLDEENKQAFNTMLKHKRVKDIQ